MLAIVMILVMIVGAIPLPELTMEAQAADDDVQYIDETGMVRTLHSNEYAVITQDSEEVTEKTLTFSDSCRYYVLKNDVEFTKLTFQGRKPRLNFLLTSC